MLWVGVEGGREQAGKVASPTLSPACGMSEWSSLQYQRGFGNEHRSEAAEGAVPVGQNSPQKIKFGLYAEQLSGTAFTAPRTTNQRSWLYRLAPSVSQSGYAPRGPTAGDPARRLGTTPDDFAVADPNARRWRPTPLPAEGKQVDFVDGLATMAGAGSAEAKDGLAIHIYSFNAPMTDRAFCNADGDLLVVPQLGALHVTTECGRLTVAPGEIFVVQRNFRFSIDPAPDAGAGCRGYVLELFDGHFRLPDLGPIGANGLAEPQDFLSPTAWCVRTARQISVASSVHVQRLAGPAPPVHPAQVRGPRLHLHHHD